MLLFVQQAYVFTKTQINQREVSLHGLLLLLLLHCFTLNIIDMRGMNKEYKVSL